MRIQHNIMAMNSYRNYSSNTSALAKNLEKLSSGYKINRAGDDAAGLAISEKMRAQITGLSQAQSNAKSGINLVQTAEGALTEVHDMLNRMVKLADQSANGTYDNDVDRANLQKEVAALQAEIDRIADASNFNGIKLLDGSMDSSGTVGGDAIKLNATSVTTRDAAVAAVKPSFAVDLDGLKLAVDNTGTGNGTLTLAIGGQNITSGDIALTANTPVTAGTIATAFDAKTVTINGVTYTAAANGTKLTFSTTSDPTNDTQANADFSVAIGAVTGTGAKVDPSSSINAATQVITSGVVEQPTKQATVAFALTKDMASNGGTITIGDETYTVDYAKTGDEATGKTIGVKDLLNDKGELDAGAMDEVANRLTKAAQGNTKFTVGSNGTTVTLQSFAANPDDLTTKENVLKQVSINKATESGKGLTLQIGDTSESFNKISVNIQDMHAKALGVDLSKVDISTQDGAASAVDAIKKAINTVSSVRGDLGATQNRLEHTINNLSVMTENIQDAESTIRDVDVAEEMMAYTKNNILVQSAQAMLAQANQVPQGVLQLLQ